MEEVLPKISYTSRYIASLLIKAGWARMPDNVGFCKAGYVFSMCDSPKTGISMTLYTTRKFIATTSVSRFANLHFEHIGVPVSELIAAVTGDIDTMEMRLNNYETRRTIEELE